MKHGNEIILKLQGSLKYMFCGYLLYKKNNFSKLRKLLF